MPAAKRSFCFDLTDAEIADTASMVAFVQKVPAVKGAGESFEASEMRTARSNFCRVINALWRHPTVCAQACDWVESKVVQYKSSKGDEYFASVSILGKLDETWLCWWVTQRYTGVTKQTLELFCLQDPESLIQLVEGMCNASRTLKLPVSMRHKVTCGHILNMLADEAGDRFKGLTDSKLKGDGDGTCMDWSKLTPYLWVWNFTKTHVVEVTHRPSKVTVGVPDHLIITDDFELWQPWSDKYASAKFTMVNHTLQNLFTDPLKGPNAYNFFEGASKPFGELVTEFVKKHPVAKAGPPKTSATSDVFLGEQKASKKVANMQQVKRKMDERREQVSRKRVIKLNFKQKAP